MSGHRMAAGGIIDPEPGWSKPKEVDMKRSDGRSAFTLVEMLVVVIIIGLLAGIMFRVGSMVHNRVGRVRTAQRLEHLRGSIEGYYEIHGQYPDVDKVCWEDTDASLGKMVGDSPMSDAVWASIKQQSADRGDPIPAPDDGLYFRLFRDPGRARWAEHLNRVPVDGGHKMYVKSGSDWSPPLPIGAFSYSNRVYTLLDSWGNPFVYETAEPYQSYRLYSDGTAGRPVGKEEWTE